MLPSVLGTRLSDRKRFHVTFSPAGIVESPTTRSSSTTGTKYMLAMLCSSPIATKALTGGTIASTLSVTVRADIAIHTARQTSTLASTAEKNACVTVSEVLASAISAVRAAI